MVVINQDINNVNIVASHIELSIIKEMLEACCSDEEVGAVTDNLKNKGFTFDELDVLAVTQQFALALKNSLARYDPPLQVKAADPTDLPETDGKPPGGWTH